MSVRRGAAWLGTACVLVGTAVFLGATPAAADGESVRVRAPSTISAGGSPGAVTVIVSMRGGDCVHVRTALGVRLPGLTADRVELQVASDGGWRRLRVSDSADGLAVTERTTPGRPVLCARKSVSSRYRLSLLAGVPAGRVTVVAEAYTAAGRLLARGADTARVSGRTGAAPVATETRSESATPPATPETTEEVAAATTQEAAAAAVPEQTSAADMSGGSLGLGGMVMVVGVVMVGIGIALLVLLIRRNRADRGVPAGPVVRAGDADETARIVLLGAEATARIVPVDAEPTARISPAGPVLRGGGPAGPVGAVGPASAGPGAADRTLILPTAGRVPPRQAGPVPPEAPPASRPGAMPSGPSRAMPPGRAGGAPPQPAEPVSPPQPAGGPDATLILPPARRPPK